MIGAPRSWLDVRMGTSMKRTRSISQAIPNKPWAVIGDFNIVRGRAISFNKLKDMNDCIDKCGPSDFRNIGRNLTWNNKNLGAGRITGRLDRALVNNEWIDLLPNSYYAYLNCASSDHCPILLHLLPKMDSGPKPFKYFNYWRNYEGYEGIIANAWNIQVHGNPLYQLISKLKGLKQALKAWSKSSSFKPQHHISRIGQDS